jgi:hypothetical protein
MWPNSETTNDVRTQQFHGGFWDSNSATQKDDTGDGVLFSSFEQDIFHSPWMLRKRRRGRLRCPDRCQPVQSEQL